jgi:tetratricopeptide (TPR) repeat protein
MTINLPRSVLAVMVAVLPMGTRAESDTAIEIVDRIRRADYEGDRAALQRLHADLEPLTRVSDRSARIRYWRGFALWRRALNGFNESADPKELEQDLTQAVKEFELAFTDDPTFVDAKVGAVSCLGSLIFLNQGNQTRLQELIPRSVTLLKEAQAAAPDNIRMLWVRGAVQWYVGPERGGGQAAAMATYEKGLALARQRKSPEPDPLMPSWGEPELLMSLAWSSLNRTTPDVAAAQKYATEALAIVPYWHYVRDILLPQSDRRPHQESVAQAFWPAVPTERERFVSASSRETGRPSS